MKNVGMKPDSYRKATATAELLAPPYCIDLLRSGQTEKGDALKTARIAGILAAKRTDELIPLCHPLPIYRADVEFELLEDRVIASAEVETIGPTGVEMEALTAASLAVLTIYDMLKPHCEPHELIIRECRLQEKKVASHIINVNCARLFQRQSLSCLIAWLQGANRIPPVKL